MTKTVDEYLREDDILVKQIKEGKINKLKKDELNKKRVQNLYEGLRQYPLDKENFLICKRLYTILKEKGALTGEKLEALTEFLISKNNSPQECLENIVGFYEMSDFDLAEKMCLKSLNTYPDDVGLCFCLADIFERQNKFNDAKKTFILALEKVKSPSELSMIHLRIGAIMIKNDIDGDGAKKEFLKALELTPNDLRAQAGIATSYLLMGKFNEAEKLCKEIMNTPRYLENRDEDKLIKLGVLATLSASTLGQNKCDESLKFVEMASEIKTDVVLDNLKNEILSKKEGGNPQLYELRNVVGIFSEIVFCMMCVVSSVFQKNSNGIRPVFVIVGDACSGKSKVGRLISELVGGNNTTYYWGTCVYSSESVLRFFKDNVIKRVVVVDDVNFSKNEGDFSKEFAWFTKDVCMGQQGVINMLRKDAHDGRHNEMHLILTTTQSYAGITDEELKKMCVFLNFMPNAKSVDMVNKFLSSEEEILKQRGYFYHIIEKEYLPIWKTPEYTSEFKTKREYIEYMKLVWFFSKKFAKDSESAKAIFDSFDNEDPKYGRV